jgi:osmotically-inducible protein OsmY
MRTDQDIQKDVISELQWDSRLSDAVLAADVRNGDVELSGRVDSYPKKLNAERAARRVAGVRSVSNTIEVIIPDEQRRPDSEIERSVFNAITWNSSINGQHIFVTVSNGRVTLEGSVGWEYQRSKARLLAEDISGVVSVTNLLTIQPAAATPAEIREKINGAFRRNSYLRPEKIQVQVEGSKVILSGQVRTLVEKKCAEEAAWSAPGITDVDNRLDVNYSEILV